MFLHFPIWDLAKSGFAAPVCTLTWWNGRDGYEVFFNRDELRTRGKALPPVVGEHHGVRFVAPVDEPSGGTWLLANQCGVTLAILNLYERELPVIPGAVYRSRGLLLRGLADCRSLDEVDARLRAEPVSLCNAFTMMGFDQGGATGFRAWRWLHDRECLSGPDGEPAMPICSSSFAAERVIAARRQTFAELRGKAAESGPGWLERFHHFDNAGQPSAETVLMRRPDARTLSISRVRVGPERIAFTYEAVPGEGEAAEDVVTCELSRG